MCGKFLVFTIVIKRRNFTLLKSYQHKSMEVKCAGITNQQDGKRNLTLKANGLI